MKFFEQLRKLPRHKTKDELESHYDNVELEKGDLPAMLLAALLTIILPCLIFVGVIVVLAMLLFGAL